MRTQPDSGVMRVAVRKFDSRRALGPLSRGDHRVESVLNVVLDRSPDLSSEVSELAARYYGRRGPSS